MGIIILGLQLTGLESSYDIGDTVSITCSTDLSVNRIVWLDPDDQEVASSETTLTLSLSSVTESLDGSQFLCRSESQFGNQEEFVVLKVASGGRARLIIATASGSAGGLVIFLVIVTVTTLLCFCAYKR